MDLKAGVEQGKHGINTNLLSSGVDEHQQTPATAMRIDVI